MIYLLQHFIMLLPVPLEAAFDAILWARGKSDKPISTWVFRPLVFAGCFLWANSYGLVDWWQILVLMGAYSFMFFNYLINAIRKEPFFYLSDGNWFDRQLKRLHNWPRLWLQIWLTILAICLYHYQNLYNSVQSLMK